MGRPRRCGRRDDGWRTLGAQPTALELKCGQRAARAGRACSSRRSSLVPTSCSSSLSHSEHDLSHARVQDSSGLRARPAGGAAWPCMPGRRHDLRPPTLPSLLAALRVATGAMFIAALAVPEAFCDEVAVFGVAFLVVGGQQATLSLSRRAATRISSARVLRVAPWVVERSPALILDRRVRALLARPACGRDDSVHRDPRPAPTVSRTSDRAPTSAGRLAHVPHPRARSGRRSADPKRAGVPSVAGYASAPRLAHCRSGSSAEVVAEPQSGARRSPCTSTHRQLEGAGGRCSACRSTRRSPSTTSTIFLPLQGRVSAP